MQVGLAGHGLNTALETLNINAGLIQMIGNTGWFWTVGPYTVWIESSAFAGGEALDLNLGGVGVDVC